MNTEIDGASNQLEDPKSEEDLSDLPGKNAAPVCDFEPSQDEQTDDSADSVETTEGNKGEQSDEDKSDGQGKEKCDGEPNQTESSNESDGGSEKSSINQSETEKSSRRSSIASSRGSRASSVEGSKDGSRASSRVSGSSSSKGGASSRSEYDSEANISEQGNDSSVPGSDESNRSSTRSRSSSMSGSSSMDCPQGVPHKTGTTSESESSFDVECETKNSADANEQQKEFDSANDQIEFDINEILPELSSDSDSGPGTQKANKETLHINAMAFNPNFGEHLMLLKIPSFLPIEAREFTHETYECEYSDKASIDEAEKERMIYRIVSKIRWRQVEKPSGEKAIESNARVIKWSDGSSTLHVGDKVFEITKNALPKMEHQLFLKDNNGMQACQSFEEQLFLHPQCPAASTSERHLKLNATALASQARGTKFIDVTTKDPVAERKAALKQELAKLREKSSALRHTGRRMRRPKLFSAEDTEDTETDDDCISLKSIKDLYRKKAEACLRSRYSSKERVVDLEECGNDESSDSEPDIRRRRRLTKSKPIQPLPDSESD